VDWDFSWVFWSWIGFCLTFLRIIGGFGLFSEIVTSFSSLASLANPVTSTFHP